MDIISSCNEKADVIAAVMGLAQQSITLSKKMTDEQRIMWKNSVESAPLRISEVSSPYLGCIFFYSNCTRRVEITI